MIYDRRFAEHIIELKVGKGEVIPLSYKVTKFILSNKLLCILISLLEKIIGILLRKSEIW